MPSQNAATVLFLIHFLLSRMVEHVRHKQLGYSVSLQTTHTHNIIIGSFFPMAALNRDSVISKISTGSGEVETLSILRQQESVDNTENRITNDPEYYFYYANIEAQLKEQEKQVTKIRRKMKRLKAHFCILIVFLVNVIFTHMFYIVKRCISKVICLLGAVGYSGFLHWGLWKMDIENTKIITTTPNSTIAANESSVFNNTVESIYG